MVPYLSVYTHSSSLDPRTPPSHFDEIKPHGYDGDAEAPSSRVTLQGSSPAGRDNRPCLWLPGPPLPVGLCTLPLRLIDWLARREAMAWDFCVPYERRACTCNGLQRGVEKLNARLLATTRLGDTLYQGFDYITLVGQHAHLSV